MDWKDRWKNRFNRKILELGYEYYKNNQVQNLTYENGYYKAEVHDYTVCHVDIAVQNNELVYMTCSCVYGRFAQRCKHMAAVAYAIEELSDNSLFIKRKQQVKKIQPFVKKVQEYQYYDMSKLTKDLEFLEDDYKAADALIKTGKIVLEGVQVEDQPYNLAYGYCEDGGYIRHIGIHFNHKSIISANCSVVGCNGYYDSRYPVGRKSICKHILGLMMLLDKYLQKYNPGDATDYAGKAFFNNFRYQHMKDVLGRQETAVQDYRLEPVIERDHSGIYLTLRGGTNKPYVIKNMTEFVTAYEDKNIMQFGTKSKIDFAMHRMDESSQKLYDFVYEHVCRRKEWSDYRRGFYYDYYEENLIKNKMDLYGECLDAFFDLIFGQTISFTDKMTGKSVKSPLEFKLGKPEIVVKVEKQVDEDQIFHGVEVSGEIPEMIQSSKHRYYIKDGTFCRIEEDMSKVLAPIFDMEKNGYFSFTVGRNYISEFYHQVLPLLKQYMQVNEVEPEFVNQYIPPEAVFAFYLDYENEEIICKPVVQYGNQKVSLIDNMKEDYIYKNFRNKSQEEEILFYLHKLFPNVDLEKEEMSCGNTDDAVLAVLDGGVSRMMNWGEVHTTERFRNINVHKKPAIQVGVSLESDIMNLSITSEDLSQDELLQILRSYQPKKKYYRLKNGDFVSVNDADMEMLSQVMDNLHITKKEFLKENIKVPAYRALYLNKMLEDGEELYIHRDKHFRKLIKEFKTVEDSDFEIPASLDKIMRKYQMQGYKWMKTLEQYQLGGILADDMGLGKTLQTISVLLSAKEHDHLGTALIVSPASLVYNWKEEFSRFAPSLEVSLVVGSAQERAAIIHNHQGCDVLITSYDLLKRDIAEYEDISFTYQIIDEAQYIKNHTTAAAKSVKIIKSKHRFALTGTPIENRLSELWSIFDYLMPGLLYGYEVFRRDFETPIVKRKDEVKSNQLKKMVRPFILRRLKGDVLKDLPEKMEEIRYAKFDTEQQRLYDGQVVVIQNMINQQDAQDFQRDKMRILAELTRIRQICCDPELLFEAYKGESAKRAACIELIQSAIEGEHKILVFSQFTSMLALLERDLNQLGIPYYKIIGDTPKEKRLEMVKAFNRDDTPVFLISLKAGGTGLNLTGADVVIHYDPWWNLAAQNQATDRAHRIGQEKVVSVYKLIVKNTIEERIVQMQETKRDLAESILSGENGSITQMSKEELLQLLE